MSQHEEFDELDFRDDENAPPGGVTGLWSIIVLIVIVALAVLWAMWRLM